MHGSEARKNTKIGLRMSSDGRRRLVALRGYTEASLSLEYHSLSWALTHHKSMLKFTGSMSAEVSLGVATKATVTFAKLGPRPSALFFC